MILFEDREKAAERQFAQDNAIAFKIIVRRNRLLGLWAAGLMGMSGQDAARYATEVVDAEITGRGDDALVKKMVDDLMVAGVPTAEPAIRRHLEMFAATARRELLEDAPKQTKP